MQIKTKGKGGFYSAPATGTLVLPVTIQLMIDDGASIECFKTTFSSFIKQNAENFKAKGP